MKKIVLAFVLINSLLLVNAQETVAKYKKSHLSFGFNAGAPVGKTTTDLVQFVVGADLKYSYSISDIFAVSASAGFDIWHPRRTNLNYVPLLAGIKFGDRFYISEQAGYAIGVSKDASINPVTIDGGFMDVAGLGYRLNPSSDIFIGYKGVFVNGKAKNALDLRISYNFGK